MKKYKYLIIGGSAAGIAAIEGIREVDRSGSIGILSSEPYHAYSRPMITNYIMDEIGLDKMYYRPLEFYKKEKVDTFLGRAVVKVLPGKKAVRLDDGESLLYEKLLIASGGRPIIPRINGVDKKGVYSFLSLDNAKEIKGSLGSIEKAVIIGGGLSGMKAAEALCSVGIKVTVVEMLERILAQVFDVTASDVIKRLFEEKGVEVLTSSQVEQIYGSPEDDSRVGGVSLKGGRRVAGDVVILAVGVLPETSFLRESGIKINKGIVVDETMKTNQPDIYAAGDVVEAYDMLLGVQRLIPIWPKAYYEGRVAGMNMAGRHKEFKGIFPMNSADFFGLPTISAGIVNPENKSWEALVEHKPETRYYKKIVIKKNKVDGMVMIGDAVDRAGIILGLIKDRVDVGSFKEKILDRDFNLIDLPETVRRARIRDAALV